MESKTEHSENPFLQKERKKERKKEKLQKTLMIKQEPRSLPTSFHCVQGYGKQQTKKHK
jgi:hypothetical protein